VILNWWMSGRVFGRLEFLGWPGFHAERAEADAEGAEKIRITLLGCWLF